MNIPSLNIRPRNGRPFVLAILLVLLTPAVRGDERVDLPREWQLQPAESAAVGPASPEWGTVLDGPFRWKHALRRVKRWAKLNVNTVHSLWYRQTLAIPAAWKGNRVWVDFRRIEGDAIVFCGDRRIGELLRPGGEIELTPAITFGADNDLRVFVTRDYTDISRGFEQDPLRYRTRGPKGRNLSVTRWGQGITAPVTLIRRPTPAAISGVFIRTSWRQKQLSADFDIETTQALAGAQIEVVVADGEGKTVLSFGRKPVTLAAGRSTEAIATDWADPIPWELEAPHFYTLTARLIGPDGVLDTLPPQRFGFREIWTEGRHVYLNGHVSRWRMEWTSFGINANSVSLLKLLGRNVVYAQNNPTAWWCDWSETPYYNDALLDLLDESGIGLLLPAPSISNIRDLALRDATARADFQREIELWVRRYRNRPCLLAWCVSMNSFNPRNAIHPDTMGQRSNYTHHQAKAIEGAASMVKSLDPTRLVYGHADGNLTDLATANTYPNFMPLQEVEDYPEIWAAKGNMPYIAAEYSLPYNGSFYNKSQFLGTEFSAIYFGNEAYRQEPEALLRQTVEIGLGNRGHGNSIGKAIPNFPMYWTLRRLYVTHSDRAWRTWGIQGWHYFNFGVGYGDPPGAKFNRFSRYAALTEPVTARPSWANPNYDMHRAAMQPLLAYLAGAPLFTDKTHAYYAGETIRKQIAVVWDGPGSRRLDARWQLRKGKEVLGENSATFEVKAGDVTFSPINCQAPATEARTELTLHLNVTEDDKPVSSDTFALQVFPRLQPRAPKTRAAVWDPRGNTAAWLTQLGLSATAIQPGDSLADYDLLLIGREALQPGARMPYSPNDLRRGLNVIVFAQRPEMWEALGFRPDDLMTRRVFVAVEGNPVLDGLRPADLRDWRGSPDLLPTFRHAYAHDGPRAPKGSNRGAVASVVLRLPAAVGFTPLLNCEFDLDYSPLLQWRYGRGSILFCTLDLEGRIGSGPAATLLAANLLRAAVAQAPEAAPLRVVGPKESLNDPVTLEAVRQGARAVVLSRPARDLKEAGFATETVSLYRASVPTGPLFNAVGPRLLRWRDAITLPAFSETGQPEGCTVAGDGLFLIQKLGRGERLFVQASPALLDGRYTDDPARRAAMRMSVHRLRQLHAQLLTNAGAMPDAALASRLCELRAGPAYETLATWNVLGPFYPKGQSPKAALDTRFPGETNAIAGDTNPNFTYKGADGTQLDFRDTVTANANGFVDLQTALKPTAAAVAYVTRTVTSEAEREAVLRIGVDYFMQVWVNGEVVYRLFQGHGSPKPNRHQTRVRLRKGENVIALKVLAGSKGFGFWANLSTGGGDATSREADPPVSLYPDDIDFFDPYEYHYW